jgi:hypothetical protein
MKRKNERSIIENRESVSCLLPYSSYRGKYQINTNTKIDLQFQSHAVMDFVVLQRNMVLVDYIPFLNFEFLWSRSELCRRQFFEVANRIVFIALDTDFFAQAIVQDYFNHNQFVLARDYYYQH